MIHLTQSQRYIIAVLHKQNCSQTHLAQQIGKHKSVVCMELKRNIVSSLAEYTADLAQKKRIERHQKKA